MARSWTKRKIDEGKSEREGLLASLDDLLIRYSTIMDNTEDDERCSMLKKTSTVSVANLSGTKQLVVLRDIRRVHRMFPDEYRKSELKAARVEDAAIREAPSDLRQHVEAEDRGFASTLSPGGWPTKSDWRRRLYARPNARARRPPFRSQIRNVGGL
ncbi:hypothetical protein KM043_005473 [Ampulex compressa]|nr:hypothetical protein KM043_005473 [Ampulex compressa]